MIRRARDIVFFALAFGFLIFTTLFVHAGTDSAVMAWVQPALQASLH
jgi:hypothetical protein